MSSKLTNLLEQCVPHTFFELLSRYRIAIPCLQRHYVQGETTSKSKEVRGNFLRNLLLSFANNAPKQLHFLFGPLDTHGADTFQPVDGQQRLTTIWLLSRYAIAWLNDEQERKSLLQILSRFNYSERIHAERFLINLTEDGRDDKKWRDNPSTKMLECGILNGGWREDRTVSSMLNTLDTIALLWKERRPDAAELLTWIWQKLTFHVRMEHFSDDLYMKINARGLPLTQWEKAKGKFAEAFGQKCDFYTRIEKLSNTFFDVMNCLPDDAFLALFGRIAHYLQKTGSKGNNDGQMPDELAAIAKCVWNDDGVVLPYIPFEQFKVQDWKESSLRALLSMIEYLLNASKDICLPEWQGVAQCPLAKAVFHPENKHQRDLSLALFEYFQHVKQSINLKDFKNTLRLFWNILGEGNAAVDDDAPYRRIEFLRDKYINSTDSSDLYLNNNRPQFQNNVSWQYSEEAIKMLIYQNPGNWPEAELRKLHESESFLHGRVIIALENIDDSQKCQSRLDALNKMGREWKEAISSQDDDGKQALIAKVMMAMPYWPQEDKFPFGINEDALRIILHKNETSLATSLLDYLNNNPNATPHDILQNNPFGFTTRDAYQKSQPWRRNWQENLLWKMENEQVLGKKVQWHSGSDCFYLYQSGNVKWAFPINDYRFDFISNDTLKKALEDFYTSVHAAAPGMTMNESSTRSTEIWSKDGHKRHLYFYCDHIAICYFNEVDKKWSPQIAVDFNEKEGESIFTASELLSRVEEFFATLTAAINASFPH